MKTNRTLVIFSLIIFFLSVKIYAIGPDEIGPDDWAQYKNWHQVTPQPTTGDPTGFLDKKHRSLKAYRVIYINVIGEATNKGEQAFPYPEGTIIVKEAFRNKSNWERQRGAQLTIMVKLAAGTSPGTGDWEYINGAKGKKRGIEEMKWGQFCRDCHVFAYSTDYTFIHSKFYADHPQHLLLPE